LLESVNRNQRYCKNKSCTVFDHTIYDGIWRDRSPWPTAMKY